METDITYPDFGVLAACGVSADTAFRVGYLMGVEAQCHVQRIADLEAELDGLAAWLHGGAL